MTGKLVEIARYYDYGEAHIAKGLLRSHGIYSEVFDDSASSTLWYYQIAMKGTRLYVRDEDAERAMTILSEVTESLETQTAPSILPQTKHDKLKAFFGVLLSGGYGLILGIFLLLGKKKK